MKCILHSSDERFSDPGPFTKLTDEKLVGVQLWAKKWLEVEVADQDDTRVEISNYVIGLNENTPLIYEEYGWHRKCHSSYTNKTLFERILKRKTTALEQEDSSPVKLPRLTRFKTGAKKHKGGSGNIIPAVCVICGEKDRFVKIKGKTARDTLSKASTVDAGMHFCLNWNIIHFLTVTLCVDCR